MSHWCSIILGMNFADRFVTVANPLAAYKEIHIDLGATRVAAAIVGSISADPVGEPLRGWSFDALLHHVDEFLFEVAAAVGAEPADAWPPGPSVHRDSATRLFRAFHRPGYVGERRPTPLGIQPGAVMIQYVINELAAHSWDFSTALNRRNQLPDWLVERSLLSWQVFFETFGRPAAHFDPERPAPPNATAATRLAAFLGREIPDSPVVLWRDPALITADRKRARASRARVSSRPRSSLSGDAMEVRFSELPKDSGRALL